MRILLVEDEPELAAALRTALGQRHMLVDHVTTLAEGEEAIIAGVHGAVLLDRNLSDGDGLRLLSHIRTQKAAVPVIVLTALGEMDDRIEGLDAGADDYLPKPFVIDELLARLRAVLRRSIELAPEFLRIGPFAFDWQNRSASVSGRSLGLARRELLALEGLLRRQGRVVQRSTLEETVYGFDDEIQSNALDMHISRLRRKLKDAGAQLEIHGVRGIGYLLKPAR